MHIPLQGRHGRINPGRAGFIILNVQSVCCTIRLDLTFNQTSWSSVVAGPLFPARLGPRPAHVSDSSASGLGGKKWDPVEVMSGVRPRMLGRAGIPKERSL